MKFGLHNSIPILNTAYDKVHIPRATLIGVLHPAEVESNEVSNISWTTTQQLQDGTKNKSTELPNLPLELSFQPEDHKSKRSP